MKNKMFKKNDTVKVILDGNNASQFNTQAHGFKGVYTDNMWRDNVYKIEGTVQLISFSHAPNIYCAYLLTLNGEEVGYVYNDAINAYIRPEKTIEFDGVEYSESTLRSLIKKATHAQLT